MPDPLPAAVLAARRALAAATAEYRAIPDAALERPWQFRGAEQDVRYGVYRAGETVEDAAAEVEAILAGAPARSGAVRRIAAATVERWELQGLLATLPDEVIDRVPKPGEWTARETLAHIVDTQRGYGWTTRWWVARPADAPRLPRVPDDAVARGDAEMPGEAADGAGTVAEIRARLDDALDTWGTELGSLDDELLGRYAVWSLTPVDVGFRLGRWGSHIAEHTIQLDKTLTWLDHRPTEVARVIRELHGAWGRLEARLFPAPGTNDRVDAVLARLGGVIVSEARSARAASGA